MKELDQLTRILRLMLLQGFDHIASIRIVKADITRDRVGLERQTNEGHSPTCTGHFFSREIS